MESIWKHILTEIIYSELFTFRLKPLVNIISEFYLIETHFVELYYIGTLFYQKIIFSEPYP